MFFFIRKQARKPVFNTVSSLFATAFVGIIKTGRLAAVAAEINLYRYHQNRRLAAVAAEINLYQYHQNRA